MSVKSKIVLTGGGSAGHVWPHFAVIPELEKLHVEIAYIGSGGIEQEIVSKAGIKFYRISSGKLRRYFSWQNFLDVFKVMLGTIESFFLLIKIRPKVVFSKGGFVAVPVCFAAKALGIPVVTHESDMTPGLATKIISKFAVSVLHSFEETKQFLDPRKSVCVGTPVRPELFSGVRQRAIEFLGITDPSKPHLLIMGGSLGAKRLNKLIVKVVPELSKKFNIIHITGRGKKSDLVVSGYYPLEFVTDEMKDIYALTDIAVSRAGANSIYELLSLHIPMILIPLEKGARGDQLHNANSFVKQGWATLIREEDIDEPLLIAAILLAHKEKSLRIESLSSYDSTDVPEKIVKILAKWF